jgi:uncharacterized protein involved in tolerance to divalent cations
MKINFIYMTVGSKEEARKIGRELVTARLAACVNILDNMNSKNHRGQSSGADKKSEIAAQL